MESLGNYLPAGPIAWGKYNASQRRPPPPTSTSC